MLEHILLKGIEIPAFVWQIGILALVAVIIFFFGDDMIEAARRASGKRGEVSDVTVMGFLKGNWKFLVVALLILVGLMSYHVVPSGYRGVVITFGSVGTRVLSEGISFKLPWQRIVDMKVMLEKEEVMESTGTKDLQEVTTNLAVHFNIQPDEAHEVYRQMRKDYHSLLLKPVIQEDLKAVTAQFTAEQLLTQRPDVVSKLEIKLRESLEGYGIYVQTVNVIDFQFSPQFSAAIEAKVTAEQEALTAKNKLEQVRWEQEQEITKAEANRKMKVITANATAQETVIRAKAEAEQKIIAAQAEAQKILLEAQAQSEAILKISESLSEQYISYTYLLEWNGKLPNVVGSGDFMLMLSPEEMGDG